MNYGINSEVGKIKSLLIKHPRDAFISQDNVDAQWEKLNYFDRPDYQAALKEYDEFMNHLTDAGIETFFVPKNDTTGLDSMYVRDSMQMTPGGAVLCNMGKEARQGEGKVIGEYLSKIEVPLLGSITGKGRLEGGDIIWLNDKTMVVGRGYRTNDEGIRQLRELTADYVDELIVVPLPHWVGPDDVFHLMSIISPIDDDLAVVYSRLMSVPFRERLLSEGIKLIEVPDDEFESMGCNILALAPRKCLMLKGNPITKKMLEEDGVEVIEYSGEEISRKGAGGPTCLTRPLLRTE